jgi:hypothetical protein
MPSRAVERAWWRDRLRKTRVLVEPSSKLIREQGSHIADLTITFTEKPP